jgi:hypothetical protein
MECECCGEKEALDGWNYCSWVCHQIWMWHELRMKPMSNEIDKELYENWFSEKTTVIEKLSTDEIKERIEEIRKIEFFAKREWAMLHQQYDKLTGRKGIAPWLKEERDRLITEPNIKVNWDGDPRKKPTEKKPKSNLLKDLLDIDISDLTKELKGKIKDIPLKAETKEKQERGEALGDVISQLSDMGLRPKPAVNKATVEAIHNKAASLKERMRLAKEKSLEKKEGE